MLVAKGKLLTFLVFVARIINLGTFLYTKLNLELYNVLYYSLLELQLYRTSLIIFKKL